ncbi:hypothetical protein A6035_16360 [Dietzia lutea]|uniref:Uncharacterized protein n=2 Tax=Dietzia lutea TaxID=546160 RepID=A0A2S1RB62_9ACTN|nr:hypothetical protein A6035_16360 [Dietzia lutea]
MTAIVGAIVAMVSGIFGISAHGLATDMGPVSFAQALTVGVTSAGIGAATAAAARYRLPMLTSALGLAIGQGAVHVAMSGGHTHHASVSHPPGHHATDPAALRAAMDTAAHDALASAAALMSPVMLAAHAAAIGSALLVIAVLAGALAWVSARTMPPKSTAHLVAVVAVVLSPRGADAPLKRYLVSRGGTRAPPAAA